ncbi:cbb3-type cytochrome oxidase assembly protein CcoS [Dyella japonica]|uniref:Cytochrome oxidase maturation protein Cbb3 n=1 Tax=Dyella japonica DSM 16301 TaxID=1440762 RepID=A0A0G9H226_9GAMM|nr:cbb3-type cytochrome oxidase assembly protein CcoS [Dyella japonica]KLD63224.1 cytochrome oxidase maturation protein Cbb3 [Dyella japonica DSM 16301]
MIILLMLVPLSLMLLAFAIGAFVWAVRKGQFDDMDTPALDILRDDIHADPPPAVSQREDPRKVGADVD